MSQNPFTISDVDTEVDEYKGTPINFSLSQNVPNPFNPTTRISYHIPMTAHVTLKVYDIRGSLVTTLVDEVQSANRYDVSFDGRQLATGIYIYKLSIASQFSETKKMLYVK